MNASLPQTNNRLFSRTRVPFLMASLGNVDVAALQVHQQLEQRVSRATIVAVLSSLALVVLGVLILSQKTSREGPQGDTIISSRQATPIFRIDQ